jgi:hypothetical protein
MEEGRRGGSLWLMRWIGRPFKYLPEWGRRGDAIVGVIGSPSFFFGGCLRKFWCSSRVLRGP